MKRTLLGILWIGAIAAGIPIALQLTGVLARPNRWLGQTLGLTTNEVSGFGNLFFVLLLGFAVATTMLLVTTLWRRLGVALLLLGELIGAGWLLDHAQIHFTPLPAMMAAVIATVLAVAAGWTKLARRRRATLRLFGARLGPAAQARLAKGEALNLSEPLMRESSFVFCEVANEVDLIEELAPAECTALTRAFIDFATRYFLQAGGYLHAADGEGIRVLFGFPDKSEQHAIDAVRATLGFRDQFRATASATPDSLGKIDLRIGISSGTVVATVRDDELGGEIVLAGEPLELARRLARANQVYGSQILLGPRTFNLAGKEILARPIDFLRNTEAYERFEIYELLALSGEATAEEIARRDQFWTGVVYFRERRWNEALAEFNRARGNRNGNSDRVVEWYLRRLEPLCLSMASESEPVAEPLSSLR
jgi:class 3 adenylate cyclase